MLFLPILLFIWLTSLPSLSVRELSNKHVKFKIVWRSALGSLFAMRARLYLANLSRWECSWLLFPEEQRNNPFPCNPSDLAGSGDDHLAASSDTSTLALRGFA